MRLCSADVDPLPQMKVSAEVQEPDQDSCHETMDISSTHPSTPVSSLSNKPVNNLLIKSIT